MLIIALVLAVIGLAALVFAVVTSNELVAWVCIGASVLGVLLLIVDAVRERQRREAGVTTKEPGPAQDDAAHDDEAPAEYAAAEASEESDEGAAPADSAADADAAETVSDDHNAR